MTINSDIQKLQPGAIVELYVLDLAGIDPNNTLYRWSPHVNELGQPIVWNGDEYTPWPISVTGFDKSGSGQIPRPSLTLGNVTGLLSAVVILNQDIVGAKFTRYRTLYQYLDAVNFTGGANPTADPTALFPTEVYYVDRKSREDLTSVQFELASPFDVHGVYLPKRQIIQNYCPFVYRDVTTGCDYVPGAMFKADDTQTTNPSEDVCGHRLSSCKLRNGSRAVGIPFGGFPGAGLTR